MFNVSCFHRFLLSYLPFIYIFSLYIYKLSGWDSWYSTHTRNISLIGSPLPEYKCITDEWLQKVFVSLGLFLLYVHYFVLLDLRCHFQYHLFSLWNTLFAFNIYSVIRINWTQGDQVILFIIPEYPSYEKNQIIYVCMHAQPN